jgi:hypothetical protein
VSPHATPAFDRYIGIDYSGAETPTSSLKGLRVYAAERGSAPLEISPPPSPRRYWTRRGIAEWLVERLSEDRATIVGIDHGFSFPIRYFEQHMLQPHWPTFLEDFQRHWPTDDDHMYVDFVRDGSAGNGVARGGNPKWRRLTELHTRGAKSVFHFDVQGSVAKSTHAGLPWLLYLRRRLSARVHFWPFDGWQICAGRSAVVEVYPALWSRSYPREHRTQHQHDAYAVAAWMRDADQVGMLRAAVEPPLAPAIRGTAEIEGWILGTPVEGMRRMASAKPCERHSLTVVKPRAKSSFGGEVEEFLDCAGKRRRFVLRIYGNGQFLEAREVLAGDVPGARIALPVKRGAAPPWGDIRKRIRERLSRRDLVKDENGRLVLVADVLRGQLTWSNDDGLALVVDDVIMPWEEVGRLLSSYEGFAIHVEIRDPVEE